jgi:D-serine deaminase-like pyridoxal phosphate-dependent protein
MIAALQHDAGATGLTVATVREAEIFASAGFDDLLLTAPAVGNWRLDRLTALAGSVQLRVVVDSVDAVCALDDACRSAGVEIGFLWELDCGVGRFGIGPTEAGADEIVRSLHSATFCRFDGLLAFGGHSYGAQTHDELVRVAHEERDAVTETALRLAARGVAVPVCSIGTTPTTHVLESAAGITEIRPGNYVFYDATQVALGLVDENRCALSVLATVVSRPDVGRAILDAGSKALAAERISPRTADLGIVLGRPGLRLERLFEEQAIAVGEECVDLRVGDRVQIVPNHACAAVNLHERMLVVEEGAVVDVWPVEAAGWAHAHNDGADRVTA